MTASPAIPPSGSILPRRIGRVLIIACWIAVLYGTRAAVPHPGGVRSVAAWISAAVFLAAFTLAYERYERPEAFFLVLASGLAGVVMQFLAPSNGALVAVIATIGVAGIRFEQRYSRVVALVTGLGFLAAGALSAHPLPGAAQASVIPALLFAYLAATSVRGLRVEQRRTQELLEEVVAGRDARIEAAALGERARLAREMHDVLAHTLSALSIQLEGTRMLAEQGPCDPAIVTQLERAGRLARDGLDEARRAVGSLRGDIPPGPDLLLQLAQAFERDTDVPCRLRVDGQRVDLPAETRLALYRVAQEALTNIRKHADATAVEVTLRYDPDATELLIDDEGEARTSPIQGGGFGLNGMRERAELLGGRLDAGPTENGFRVHLWLPRRTAIPSAS